MRWRGCLIGSRSEHVGCCGVGGRGPCSRVRCATQLANAKKSTAMRHGCSQDASHPSLWPSKSWSVQETAHRCRSRTMPQVHRHGGEEGGRAGCGAYSRVQCSDGSESLFQRLEAGQAAARNFLEPSAPLPSSPDCAQIVALKAKLAEVEGERRCDSQSVGGSRLRIRWGPDQDKSAEGTERTVTVVPRGVRRSNSLRKRDQNDGVEFSSVRWRCEVVRVDGGHGAVRS